MQENSYKYKSQFKKVRYTIYFLVFFLLIEPYISQELWSGFNFFTIRIYFILELFLLFKLIKHFYYKKIVKVFLLLLSVVFISNFLNFNSLEALIIYYKNYMLPVVIFIWLSIISDKNIEKLIFIFFILNIILNLTWLANINPLPNSFANTLDDFAIGTMGSIALAFISAIFCYYGIIYRKTYLFLLSLISLIMTNSVTTIIFAALAMIFSYLIVYGTKITNYIYSIIVIFISIFIIASVLEDPINIFYGTIEKHLYNYSPTDYQKAIMYNDLVINYKNNIVKLPLGFGPGNRVSEAAEETNSQFYEDNSIHIGEYSDTSILGKYYSGFASLLWEIGILGFLLYLYILFIPLLSINDNNRIRAIKFFVIIFFIMSITIFDPFRDQSRPILYYTIIATINNFKMKRYKIRL